MKRWPFRGHSRSDSDMYEIQSPSVLLGHWANWHGREKPTPTSESTSDVRLIFSTMPTCITEQDMAAGFWRAAASSDSSFSSFTCTKKDNREAWSSMATSAKQNKKWNRNDEQPNESNDPKKLIAVRLNVGNVQLPTTNPISNEPQLTNCQDNDLD